MENHGTSTGNIKALRFYHVLAPTSRGFNSVSTDNFPIFGETWGNMEKMAGDGMEMDGGQGTGW